MNKELTKEEAEEYYNKLWLENKELIQENIDKLNIKRFALEMKLIDKDKEIERLKEEYKTTCKEKNKYISTLEESLCIAEERYLKSNSIIKEVREYIGHYETIRGYYEYKELGYDEYNYDEDLKQELLEILDKENK